MSVLTIAQIKSEIRVILGGRTDGDSRLNGVINMSNQRLSRLYDFDELRGRATLTTVVTANAADDKYISLATLGEFV